MTTIAAMKMEGLYESVYNARWSHVVEVSGGEGTGMEVKEGKPKQSWTYKKAGNTFEKDDGVQQSGEAPPRLMVLTSDDGWPYTMNLLRGAGTDFFVNCEVERVWQIVKGDLTAWFSNFDLTLNSSPLPRVDWDARDREVDGCRLVPPLPAAALRCGGAPSGCPLFWRNGVRV
ncbi:putative retrotransposon hot spot (RHS) protein [Trypanosoma cruzi]|uniref:Putative retrotransposon hot spot (RHS) protein n=1 Tax=Trypanosoma cruzi TaxID=5693 RepID=A0A2V2VUG6_TRYCR|nr:putative retrotransposon hot spot (RHS) protein [Trypanosoma cruzi]RNC35904.1 retrotransposon hot spot (RHS) protein [Trypanosoma cruzi]